MLTWLILCTGREIGSFTLPMKLQLIYSIDKYATEKALNPCISKGQRFFV